VKLLKLDFLLKTLTAENNRYVLEHVISNIQRNCKSDNKNMQKNKNIVLVILYTLRSRSNGFTYLANDSLLTFPNICAIFYAHSVFGLFFISIILLKHAIAMRVHCE